MKRFIGVLCAAVLAVTVRTAYNNSTLFLEDRSAEGYLSAEDYVFYQDSGKARQYYSLIDYQTALEQEIGALRRKTALHTPVKTLALILQSYRLSAKDCQALIQVLEEMQKLEKKQT